ncbi:MAG: hypothetical protein A2289_03995 [Deltaproteobacteria bacterium RIFOXYA12_FULL_58_15]|nr:MAG: hypothetical protein A2289_03995 [Deltaproteobacteria bacterium RIFOXYA12_FULL_58_15]
MALSTLLMTALLVGDVSQSLSQDQIDQTRLWIEAMKESERGPYQGVMWFCKDGTILAPKMYACAEHGGGDQYGVLSNEAKKLAAWGIHVGTILNALGAGAFAADDYYRARAYVVESYLERALDGWALEKAKDYRGFRQVEDEVEAVRWQLIDMAMRSDVLFKHRNLLIRAMRASPYGKGGSRADEVRALAGVLGDEDMKGFGDLRFKIHAMPEPSDIEKVEAYAKTKVEQGGASAKELATKATELAQKMREYYEPTHRLERLKEVKKWIGDRDTQKAIDAFAAIDSTDTFALVRGGTELIKTTNRVIRGGGSKTQGERNLLAFHVMAIVEELWIGVTAGFSRAPMTRADTLEMLTLMVQSAGPLGWLSDREQATALAVLEGMQAARPDPEVVAALLSRAGPLGHAIESPTVIRELSPEKRWAEPDVYAAGVSRLSRILEWGRARLLADLGLALERYGAVESRAHGVVDDQLRSSVMLPLASLLDKLDYDVEQLRGGGHLLIGLNVGKASLRGENPGVANGKLRVLNAREDPQGLRREEIVLLQDLPPELPPVAGIITVGSAGSLSHVSLLARNLGIPHATVAGQVAAALLPFAGREVVLGVSAGGRVVIGPANELPDEAKSLVQTRPAITKPFLKIDANSLDLETTKIFALSEISEGSSGVIVGPKAAELGRLKRLFPDRVSDAAVIPFAAFRRHVDRAGPNGEPSPLTQLRRAYAETAKLSASESEKRMLVELEGFREQIATLPFPAGFEEQIDVALGRLGDPGSFGVFVRSDTNVEDLKEFTGAGLNLTVANRVGQTEVLKAIRAVWASPFTERSYRWRQRILINPEHVYPSVILHRTVPSEISGVMVTTDLEGKVADAITISASEGVSAVVDGGAPETIVIDLAGTLRLLASARSATRKVIPKPPAQGVVRLPSEGLDPLLGPAAIADLRGLAVEVNEKIPGKEVPWDIEFGFLGDRAYLMQIRPLRISKSASTHPYLRELDSRAELPATMLDLAVLIN